MYVPREAKVAVSVSAPVQRIENGAVPVFTANNIEPSVNSQIASVTLETEISGPSTSPIIIVSIVEQPVPSLMVTSYTPADKFSA